MSNPMDWIAFIDVIHLFKSNAMNFNQFLIALKFMDVE